MFCCLRCFYRIKSWVNSTLYSEIPVLKSETITNKLEKLTLDSSSEHIVKYRISDGEQLTDVQQLNLLRTQVKTPWLWIGGVKHGKVIDMTSIVDQYVLYNNLITLNTLGLIDPYVVGWKMLDTTLNEVNFPISGIVIKDAARVQGSEKEM